MLHPDISRRVGQQLPHRRQDIVVSNRLAVVPVRAATQIEMPAPSPIKRSIVVCQIAYRVRLTGFIAG